MEKYNKLIEYQEQISELQCAINILNWDLRLTVPKYAKDYVIEICGKLQSKVFELKTSKLYEKLLLDCINGSHYKVLEEAEKRYIKNLLRHYYEDTRVPSEFYNEYVKLCSKSTSVWEEAKNNNDYNSFKPYLEKIIDMTKQYYRYIDSKNDLYDVMLDKYETGMTSEVIDKLFKELKEALLPLIKKAKIKEDTKFKVEYTEEELLSCAKLLLEYIGFDMNKGTLGIFTHGFTEKCSYNDIRIAYKKNNDPIQFVTTVIHEGGHGLFEQNIKENLAKYENVTIDNLYALHESQSRFYENVLGRNINFWYPIYDKIKEILKLDLSIEEFVNELNKPQLNAIRVDADELTYCLHIILRYEIERELFSGNISVDELPHIWNKKMKEYLNIDVIDDTEGILQDIHWSEGGFGYFPSYLLGTIYDGMFIEYIEENLGNIDSILRKGEIKKITEFLSKNIYSNGGAYTSNEIFEKVLDKKLTVKPIINYFYNKF